MRLRTIFVTTALATACGGHGNKDGSDTSDTSDSYDSGSGADSGTLDSGTSDSGTTDTSDSGSSADSGTSDTGTTDTSDTGSSDSDAATDTSDTGCVSSPEVCDGADNDCDGIIDEEVDPQVGDLVITELYFGNDTTSAPAVQWVEIKNTTGSDYFLCGDGDWQVSDETNTSGVGGTLNGGLTIPAGGYAVIGGSTDTSQNGNVPVDVFWGVVDFNDGFDSFAIVHNGVVLDSVSWGSGAPFVGGNTPLSRGTCPGNETESANDSYNSLDLLDPPSPGAQNSCP